MSGRIVIEKTQYTPAVLIDKTEGVIEFEGRSIPEDSIGFYRPIFDYLDGYSIGSKSKVLVSIKLEYFDTSSSKCLFDIFKKLEKIRYSGKELSVNWYYEEDDEEMRLVGEDYKSTIDVPVNLIGVEQLF